MIRKGWIRRFEKNTEEGMSEMSGIIEKYAQKYAKKHAKKQNREQARFLIRRGKDTLEEIAEICPELTIDEIRKIEAKELARA